MINVLTANNVVPPVEGPVRSRTPEAGRETRERVLQAAARLFSRRGYSGVSIADVALAAGVSKAGLLHHFSSQEELFTQVLARRDVEDARAAPGESAQDMWAALEWWVGIVERNVGRRSLVSIYTAMTASVLDAEHPAHDWMVGHLGGTINDLVDMVEQGKADGAVRPDAPSHLIARTLVALSDGLQVQWLADQIELEHGRGGLGGSPPTDMVAETRMVVDMLKTTWAIPSGRTA